MRSECRAQSFAIHSFGFAARTVRACGRSWSGSTDRSRLHAADIAWRVLTAALAVILLCPAGAFAVDRMTDAKSGKETKWIPVFDTALLLAHRQDKIILAYFSGSDWDPWCQKLDTDVLNTPMFRDWAEKNVVLFRADFPKLTKLSSNIRAQNDRLKQKFSVIKTPTFVLIDSYGLPFARAGFDEAKLRDEEAKGQPKAWIKFLEDTIHNRPKDEDLNRQAGLNECLTYATKHFISALLLVSQGHIEHVERIKEDLLKNQQFVRYVNRNLAFTEIEWPYETDNSPKAVEIRDFLDKQKVNPAPLQLLVWDMQRRKVMARISSIDPNHVDGIIALIQAQLPKIDYNGGWIEDYRTAQAIAQQQKRYMLLAFTSDNGDYSKKMDDEIFKTDDFKAYSRKHLVTVKVDFPTAATQPVTLVNQNKMLAEMYAIRGFPTIILLNPQGQKIGDTKYMKGGPALFLKNMDTAITADSEKRKLMMGED